jgi:siroheme synthase
MKAHLELVETGHWSVLVGAHRNDKCVIDISALRVTADATMWVCDERSSPQWHHQLQRQKLIENGKERCLVGRLILLPKTSLH